MIRALLQCVVLYSVRHVYCIAASSWLFVLLNEVDRDKDCALRGSDTCKF